MKNFINIALRSIVVILSLTPTNGQFDSPCPNFFEYRYGTTRNANELYGAVLAPVPQDSSNVIKLEVQISVGNRVQGNTGNIDLGATRAEIVSDLTNKKPLRYLVYFPQWANIPPKVTKIEINGKVFCSGDPVDRTMVSYVTTLNLQHLLTIAGTSNAQSQDNWYPLPNSFNIPTQTEAPSKQQPSFYFFLGAPPGNQQPSTFQQQNNPFFTQGVAESQGSLLDSSLFQSSNMKIPTFSTNALQFGVPNSDFPKQSPDNPKVGEDRSILHPQPKNKRPTTEPKFPTNVQFGETNNDSSKQIPPVPNKSKVEQVHTPSKNKQPNDLPPTESNLVTHTQTSSDVCGISVNSNNLLINGNRVARHLHPWLAALFMQNEQGLKFMCGTSLISRKHVITAAHCVRNKRRKFNPEELWVVLGRENIQKWSNDGAQIIQADSTHYYPDHQFHTADADIALIVLSEEVTFSPSVRPVCLWSGGTNENLIVGQNGTVVGWGKDEQGRVFTPEPRQVTMPVVSEETCLRSNAGFREITSNRTFCAGNKDDSGPCNGDSGSGFLFKKRERWYIRGVVSMSLVGSDGNCDLKQYIVFTDVAKYAEWIKSFLNK